MERRITGLRFRNVGIRGELPVPVISRFTALEYLDLSSDQSKPFDNLIILPAGEDCVSVDFCLKIECDFGREAPLCLNGTVSPTSPELQLSTGAWVGIGIGASIVLLILLLVMYICMDQRRQRLRREQRERSSRSKRRGAGQELYRKETAQNLQSTLTRRASIGDLLRRDKNASQAPRSGKSFVKRYRPKPESEASSWVQSYDPMSGATYWANTVTGEFSWHPPPSEQGDAPIPPPSRASPITAFPAPPPSRPGSWSAYPIATDAPSSSYGNMAPFLGADTLGTFGSAPGGFGSNGGGGYGGSPNQGLSASNPSFGQSMPALPPAGLLDTSVEWQEVYDSTTDESYWINTQTNEITYRRPPGF